MKLVLILNLFSDKYCIVEAVYFFVHNNFSVGRFWFLISIDVSFALQKDFIVCDDLVYVVAIDQEEKRFENWSVWDSVVCWASLRWILFLFYEISITCDPVHKFWFYPIVNFPGDSNFLSIVLNYTQSKALVRSAKHIISQSPPSIAMMLSQMKTTRASKVVQIAVIKQFGVKVLFRL